MVFCKNKLRSALLIIGLIVLVALTACGEEIPTKPVARTTSAIINLPQSTPVKITYTAGVSKPQEAGPSRTPVVSSRSDTSPTPAIVNVAVPSPSLVFAATPVASPVPFYAGLKAINLEELGQVMSSYLTQNSPSAKASYYYMSDNFDKLAQFYNNRMEGLNYSKITEQILPTQLNLKGNVLIYSRGEGAAIEVIAIMVLGPLDSNLATAFGESATAAKVLKAGDSLVIIISGLSGADLAQMQKSLRSGGN